LLRLTAKATQFGRRTFTSWLIESAGTVPIQRKKDAPGENPDNVQVMSHLMDVRLASHLFLLLLITIMAVSLKALELGDAVCLFPEGMSRYHPAMAPLKTGGMSSKSRMCLC
jgi:glycerol-3-phosphate O-acyltransferase/dihydroxyacetone phosphate acyltransferase